MTLKNIFFPLRSIVLKPGKEIYYINRKEIIDNVKKFFIEEVLQSVERKLIVKVM